MLISSRKRNAIHFPHSSCSPSRLGSTKNDTQSTTPFIGQHSKFTKYGELARYRFRQCLSKQFEQCLYYRKISCIQIHIFRIIGIVLSFYPTSLIKKRFHLSNPKMLSSKVFVIAGKFKRIFTIVMISVHVII